VTLDQYHRAQLAAFASHEAGETGSIDCMKAVCYVMANRVKRGWHDGNWLEVMAMAFEHDAHAERLGSAPVHPQALYGLLREIEDIYYGHGEDPTREVVGKCLYYQLLMRKDLRPWFVENIVRKPDDHPRRAQVGMIVLYE
jgi:hypothetical protein